jgi:hypothetical protein
VAADIIAPIVTGIVGIFGFFFVWLTGKQSREHAELVAEKASQAALQLSLTSKRYKKLTNQINLEVTSTD